MNSIKPMKLTVACGVRSLYRHGVIWIAEARPVQYR
jgi:hypothetical protein